MMSGIRTVIYPVKDLAQAKTLYGKLVGVEPYMDELTTSASTLKYRMLVWIPMATARG